MLRGIVTSRFWITFGVFLCLAGTVAAQDKNWVGKAVIPKTHGVKLSQRDNTEAIDVVATVDTIVLAVLQEDGKQIEVRDSHGGTGWVAKADVVLMADAVAFFTERLRTNEKDSEAYCYRGAAHASLGEKDKALEDFTAAIKLEPTHAHLFINRGSIYLSKDEADKGIADFDEAVRLHPKFVAAIHHRGLAHVMKRDADKALKDFDEAVRLDPKDATAIHGRGMVYLLLKKDTASALGEFSDAIRACPTYGPGLPRPRFPAARPGRPRPVAGGPRRRRSPG